MVEGSLGGAGTGRQATVAEERKDREQQARPGITKKGKYSKNEERFLPAVRCAKRTEQSEDVHSNKA